MSKDNKNRFSLEDDSDIPQMSAHGSEGEYAGGHGNGGNGGDDDPDYASPERFEQDKVRLVDFLQYPRDKRKLTDFLEETYKAYERESVDRTISRVIHEHDSEMRGSTPFYKPGHIGALMYEFLNMIGVEAAFVSGLQHTKSSMTKTVQQRVDEINTLLRGVGGFNRQIKASFSRSAVIYLEQEDPHHKHREKVIFTINLGDFELRYPLDESADTQTVEDGRTLRRLVWDEAVNTLAEIVSNTGMKPKYVKNDKNICVFTMRQVLLSESEREPDEYFTFDLRHINAAAKDQREKEYVATLDQYADDIAACELKVQSWWTRAKTKREFENKIFQLKKERDYYIGTRPDPRQMDTGLIFSIAVNTLKDYTITKDKMQVIMTKYILALSRIAVDKSMDQQVSTVYQQGQKKPTDFQHMEESMGDTNENQAGNKKVVVMKDDLMKNMKKTGGGNGGRR